MRAAPALRRHARRVCCERLEDRLVLSGLFSQTADLQPLVPVPTPEVSWADPAYTAATNSWSQSAQRVRDEYGFTGDGQTVVVVDTGIAYDHVALGSGIGTGHHVVGGWDFSEESDADPYDDAPAGFHGTHVAGIIAAQDPLHPGIAPNVDLVALRVFNDMGSSQLTWIENALLWTHEHRDSFHNPITTVNLSLGTSWNGDAPPAWAALEDEFQLLTQDGITIVAAAGNGFATYQQPGLTYPAVSPYVIPVASVNSVGELSQFSQRNERVLAAPGERIVSTVPDYLLGADGIRNDWTAATGTSMAAPQISGAAVLVREAMEWVEYAAISPRAIYEHLMQTADTIFDAATQASYQRANLERAVATLLPADEAGDDLVSAHRFGALAADDRAQFGGRLTSLHDVDMFRLSAAATGQLELVSTADVPILLLDSEGNVVASGTDNTWTQPVSAGEQVVLAVAADNTLAKYDLSIHLQAESPVRIDGHVVTVLGTDSDDVVEFYRDRDFVVRINEQDFRFAADTVWRLDIRGGAGADKLVLRGNSGLDSILLRADTAEMTGSGYFLQADGFEQIHAISERTGTGIARIYSVGPDDQLIARPTEVTLTNAQQELRVTDFGQVFAYADNAPAHLATLYGSAGDDVLEARPNSVVIRGDGYENHVVGFHDTVAYGGGGTHDIAYLYDSPGNDQLVATAETVTFTGRSFQNRVIGFDRTEAFASSGVNDVAQLQGTAGDDEFVSRGDIGYLRGAGFYNKVTGFDRLLAAGGSAGFDHAHFFSSIGRDVFWSRGDYGALYGDRYYNRATGFASIHGYTTRGEGANSQLVADAADRMTNWLRSSMGIEAPTEPDRSHASELAATLLHDLYVSPLQEPATEPLSTAAFDAVSPLPSEPDDQSLAASLPAIVPQLNTLPLPTAVCNAWQRALSVPHVRAGSRSHSGAAHALTDSDYHESLDALYAEYGRSY